MVALPERNNNNLLIGDYLLASLLCCAKASQNGLPNSDELRNWVAIIVPDKAIFVNETVESLENIFTATSGMPVSKSLLGKIFGTYTFDSGERGSDISWLVISWMKEMSENNWEQVRGFAAKLQRNSGEECIGVIKNGALILVRDWG